MFLLSNSPTKFDDLIKRIRNQEIVDYVYMYPPRQAYQIINATDIVKIRDNSFERFPDINLYFHFPFCNQICNFCNIYSTNNTENQVHSEYIDTIIKEFLSYAHLIKDKKVNTIYLGGGTPSLFKTDLIQKLLNTICTALNISLSSVSEISIETSPETVTFEKFFEFKKIGINRVNLGFQSTDDKIISQIGRKYKSNINNINFDVLNNIGFKNVCIDLIYGLPNQLINDFIISLQEVIVMAPDTICIYPYTKRPFTGYYKKDTNDLLRSPMIDEAINLLSNGGYQKETHVRFVKRNSNGGYIQKRNHWSLQNLLGFGAGARSYLWNLDYRNGYSILSRNLLLNSYFQKINNSESPIVDGFIMTEDERKRKFIILNLLDLDCNIYNELFASDVSVDFKSELEFLIKNDLLILNYNKLYLTDVGAKYRDLIVQLFFSDEVRFRIENYIYAV